MKNDAIAIITARGGSKRIPRKNVKEFCGYPIISYSIRAAMDSGCFSEVMVSTDDEQIALLAKNYGASVPFYRSKKNSDDFATTVEVLQEVLETYSARNQDFSYGCCIYPTAPFVTPAKLRASLEILKHEGVPSVVSTVRYSFPPQRAFQLGSQTISYWMPENALKRSQDLPPLFHDAGQFYWFKVDDMLKHNSLVMKGSRAFECPETEVQDIDTEIDWKLAEMKFSLMK